MKKLKRNAKYLPLLLFSVFMLTLTTLNLFLPDRAFSSTENRPLAQAPKISLDSLLSNEYSAKVDTYINDQFLLRDQWISAKSIAETAFAKLENNNVLYGDDRYLFDKALTFNDLQFERNLAYVQEFLVQPALKPDSVVYFSLLPSSGNILQENLPAQFPAVDEAAYIAQAHSTLAAAGFQIVDYTSTLTLHKTGYIYYKTDHHWTTFGAYYAYLEFTQTLGIAPFPLSQWERHAVEDFFGTYYSKAKKVGTLPDTVFWYDVPVSSIRIGADEKTSLYAAEQWEERDKYAAFLHSNNAVTVITNDKATQGVGSRLVLFKDSYGNSFAPFLAAHFEELIVLDLRYIQDIKPLLEQYPSDLYYILYSSKNFTLDDNLVKFSSEH